MSSELTERVASDVHRAWVEAKLSQGVTSRPSADGVEQMVPYGDLPDHLQELDRATVRAVLSSTALRDVLAAAARDAEKVRVLGDAITDLCWKATPYGGGDSVGMYLLPAGTVHRLIGAAQGAGIPAAFRALAAGPEATT